MSHQDTLYPQEQCHPANPEQQEADILGGDSDELIASSDARIVMKGSNAIITLSNGSGYIVRFTKKTGTETTWEIERL